MKVVCVSSKIKEQKIKKKQNIKRIVDQFNFLLCGRRESRACSGRLQCESDLPRTGNETSTERQSDRQFAGQAMKFWAILRLTIVAKSVFASGSLFFEAEFS